MKKLLVLLIALLVITGCSSNANKKDDVGVVEKEKEDTKDVKDEPKLEKAPESTPESES